MRAVLLTLMFASALNYRIMVGNPNGGQVAPRGASTDIPIN